jgi:hypothetical protein
MTPIEFDYALKYSNRNVEMDMEFKQSIFKQLSEMGNLQYKTQYEILRHQLFSYYNWNSPKGKGLKRLQDLWKFPWDSDEPEKPQSVEEMRSILYSIAREKETIPKQK